MSLRERTRRVGIVGPLIVALEPGTPVPAIHLDLYLIRNSKPLKWRADEVSRLVDARLDKGSPIIVEGVFVLDVLDQIGRTPGFFTHVRGEGGYGLSKLAAPSDWCAFRQARLG